MGLKKGVKWSVLHDWLPNVLGGPFCVQQTLEISARRPKTTVPRTLAENVRGTRHQSADITIHECAQEHLRLLKPRSSQPRH